MFSTSSSLPTAYHISGLREAEGIVFLSPLSAETWLSERGLSALKSSILPVQVVYYPSARSGRFRSTEDLVAERNEALDKEFGG